MYHSLRMVTTSATFAMFSTILVLVLAIVAFTVALRSRRNMPLLTEPRCAKCNYDLRGFTGTVPSRCSECGADLTARHAIVWGTNQPQPRKIWATLALGLVFPLLFLFPMLLVKKAFTAAVAPPRGAMMFPGSPGFSSRSNAAVIASLPNSASTPWDWQELEKRQSNGSLSDTDITQAIDQLIIYLKKQPINQPLSWCERFITSADAAGKISDAQYQRLAKAFYKTCTVSVAGTVRSGTKLPIIVHDGGPWQLPGAEVVYALRQVTINDGGKLPMQANDEFGMDTNPDYLSAKTPMDIFCHALMKYPPGDYTLTFTVDVAVLQANTAPQIQFNKPGQAGRWPNGRSTWTDVITMPLKLIDADQSPISLVTDPTFNPRRNAAIHVKAIRVLRKDVGERVMIDLDIDGRNVPCSFDITLKIAGQEYAGGNAVAYANISSFTQGVLVPEPLDPSVLTADVLFQPNPAHAEGVPGVDRIWGSPINFLKVPLQRYDLPGK